MARTRAQLASMERASTGDPRPQGSQTPNDDEPKTRGTKRSINLAAYEELRARKRQRLEDILGRHEPRDNPDTAINPIAFWINEGTWPFAYIPPQMEEILT
ncbi:uncharacterized protein TrAtP1_002339 [Trichoderma atroviride]|uniref:Uncharacterized protein n=1 Tax=Hypocrea atroviridis (strain ATCC 20476 / IMI 206040) TaxID=452589 RepID=G9P232_HYPAI|nr:uncharacterized protein TRIATDRAFT_300761 [Trichoderma atroviride IMI 206040]EHK42627.1 hypothetical protein TRIATDRAFT_300761 [Trichoderma atroviride IMI 206040]UKZ61067.1 hypothetical protein TrAtP1_002339 [Trichoderma atroviride]